MKRSLKLPLTLLIPAVLMVIAASLILKDHQSTASASSVPDSPSTVIYMPVYVRGPREPGGSIDLATYMIGDGRLYEVWRSINNSQARHQTQIDGYKFFHTKGDENHAEWEELWADADFIYRGTDTSPSQDQYYTLRESGKYGSPWAPRYWKVGGVFERNPLVTFYWENGCSQISQGTHRTWLKFEEFHSQFTFPSGITLDDVVQLAWLLSPGAEPTERYYYAKSFGLVGWSSNDRGFSHISEIHQPGARLDNTREIIGCINTSGQPFGLDWSAPIEPLSPAFVELLRK